MQDVRMYIHSILLVITPPDVMQDVGMDIHPFRLASYNPADLRQRVV
jgi:hypothetical protein